MKYVLNITEKFKTNSVPENIKPMSDYMKGKFEFFGIKTPERRKLSKEIFAEFGYPDEQEFEKVIRKLWAEPQREVHYFTLDLIHKLQKKLKKNYLQLWEDLIVTNSWWDSVDGLAAGVIGEHFKTYPDEIYPVTEKWINSGNIWLQRTSLLFQLKYKADTDEKLLSDYILRLKDSNEFFIKKAIGWILREYSKTNPDYVTNFVKENTISEFSKREAMKWLNSRK
ncbi:MAG: DNA alkylation repair protein [Rhodothermaceae bacterium]